MTDTTPNMQKIVEAARIHPGIINVNEFLSRHPITPEDYPVTTLPVWTYEHRSPEDRNYEGVIRQQAEDMARLQQKLKHQRKNLRDLNKAHVMTLHHHASALERMKMAEAETSKLLRDLEVTRDALKDLQNKCRQLVG